MRKDHTGYDFFALSSLWYIYNKLSGSVSKEVHLIYFVLYMATSFFPFLGLDSDISCMDIIVYTVNIFWLILPFKNLPA